MRRPLAALSLALAALGGTAATSHAGFFPAEAVDGPTPDITAVGDVDTARDGGAALVYLKKDAGADHVFVSRLDGAFGSGQRVDQGLSPASSQPVVAASNNGRFAIAYVNGSTLYTVVKAKDASGFSAPVPVAEGVSNPSIDMSINGVTYLAFHQGGDVRVARAPRDSAAFSVIGDPVDADRGRDAGSDELTRPRVAVSADGVGVVVWGEDGADGRTHVRGRRLFEQRLSSIVEDLTVDSFDNRAGGNAEVPEIDMEDDSSYAQVVFRQQLAGGAPRALARRLVGSQFEAPFAVDGGAGAGAGRVDLTGRGEGLFAVQGAGNETIGSILFDNELASSRVLAGGGGGVANQAIPAVGENEDGLIARMQGGSSDASVRANYIEDLQRPQVGPEVTLSTGAVDPEGGFDAAASRLGDGLIAFVQGSGGERRLVAAYYDRPPARPVGFTTQRVRKPGTLRWSETPDLLGGVRYTVNVDGKPIGQSTRPELTPAPGALPEGQHTWQIVATDRRGQSAVSRGRVLRVDATPPTLRASVRRRGRVVSISARGSDAKGREPSGFSRIAIDFGNGRKVSTRGRITYRYPRGGTYTLTISAVDRAGNRTTSRRRIRL